VSKRKTYSLLFPLVLAAALLEPHAALGSRFPEGPGDAAAETDGAAADAADEAQPRKRKGNAFTRALGAPFRALARLFGGGKSKSETAKKSPAPTQETTAAASTQSTQNVETARNVAAEESKPGKGDAAPVSPGETTAAATSSAPVEAPRVEPIAAPARAREAAEVPGDTAVATRASEGVRVVRPSVGEVARELQPRMWIPKIVGVPSDPVSQGRALLQHGYVQEAIAELQTAATTGLPENLGYSLYLADDYRGALKRLKQAARLAPNEPVIFNNLGVVNARLGRYGDAYKNFARGSNEYEAHLKLAGILEDQRRDREAVKHYEAALRLQPGASAVLERLVALYERTGARDKADTARRALGRPKNPQKTATGGGG
jgi:Flp pilus assembly protein TadD